MTSMPHTPCNVLQFIRDARIQAVRRSEHGEVIRREREEREHLDKCAQCAMNIQPLYLELWPDAMLGVDEYAIKN